MRQPPLLACNLSKMHTTTDEALISANHHKIISKFITDYILQQLNRLFNLFFELSYYSFFKARYVGL